MNFMALKSLKNVLFLRLIPIQDSDFTAVKRDAKFLARYVKGLPFVNTGYMKGVPFLSKLVYKRVRGWTLGWSLPI